MTVFSGSRNELHPKCFQSCPNRCMTYFFEMISLKDQKNLESNHSIDDDEIEEVHDTDIRAKSAFDFIGDFDFDDTKKDNQNDDDFLEIFLFRSQTQDTVHNLILNRAILYLNIFSILSIFTGFNFFLIINFLSVYVKHYNPYFLNRLKSIDLNRLLFHILKILLFIGFLYHLCHMLKELEKSKFFETLVLKRNDYVENITITFCFNLSKLVDKEKHQDYLDINNELNYKLLYLNPEFSESIDQLVKRIYIYSRDYFKDKATLDNYLSINSEIIFYEGFKCWKINFDFASMTNIVMNSNIVKYTTLDNRIKFKFTKPYDGVYLSEYNLYPYSYFSFDNRRFFRKSIKIYNDEFKRKGICLDYKLVKNGRCMSRGECVRDCLVRTVFARYNFYTTNYKYLPRYKNELDIDMETRFAFANKTILSPELYKFCRSKFPLPDCKNVEFKFKDFRLTNDYQIEKDEYILDLNFDEISEEKQYSFEQVQIVIYMTNLCFIWFGASFSGLFSLFKCTRLKKLDSMKLIFIITIVYIEYQRLINLYSSKKLIYDIEFDTSDSMNIPKITACFKILNILKDNQTDFDTDLLFNIDKQEEKIDYYLYLDKMKNKKEIDLATKNLSELFHSITFLANDFGTYTVLTKRTLSSLEHLGTFNSLSLSSFLFHSYKCYSFELKFKAHSNEIFDLDYVIR